MISFSIRASYTTLRYDVTAETREFSINISYVFTGHNVKDSSLDHVLRYVSRVEALIHDNHAMILDKGADADSSNLLNCRMESCTLDNNEDESSYIAQWDFKCQHVANMS